MESVKKSDFLVLGSGIAGLTFALKARNMLFSVENRFLFLRICHSESPIATREGLVRHYEISQRMTSSHLAPAKGRSAI